MRTRLLVLLLGVFTVPSSASAHDIGIAQAELLEHAGNRYVLAVQAGPAAAYLFAPPVLPDKCRFEGNPRGGQGTRRLRFEFACDEALTAADTLLLPWRRDGAILAARWIDGSEAKRFFRRDTANIPVPLAELRAGSGSWLDAANRYISLGIEHILLGLDHLLFVAGLLLLVQGALRLVKTITAFTMAHSITLALATLGVVHVRAPPVEAAIALSIVFIGVEILHARQGRYGLTVRYPWVVAFAFGLLHGLGFAGALSAVGLPQKEIPLALLFFNVGVEIGQLMFVLLFLALCWAFRRLEVRWPRWVEALPGYAIGTAAALWFLQRTTIIFQDLWRG